MRAAAVESENLKFDRLLFSPHHITCPSGGGPSSLWHAPHHLDTRHSLLVRLLLLALSRLLPRSSCLLLTILTSLAGGGSRVLTLPIGFGRNRITLFLTPNFTAQPVPVSALRNSSKLMDGKERGRKRENTHKRKSNSGVARSKVAVTSKDSEERGWVAGSGDVPRGSPLSRLSLLSEPWKSSSSALGTVSKDLPSQPPKRPVL